MQKKMWLFVVGLLVGSNVSVIVCADTRSEELSIEELVQRDIEGIMQKALANLPDADDFELIKDEDGYMIPQRREDAPIKKVLPLKAERSQNTTRAAIDKSHYLAVPRRRVRITALEAETEAAKMEGGQAFRRGASGGRKT